MDEMQGDEHFIQAGADFPSATVWEKAHQRSSSPFMKPKLTLGFEFWMKCKETRFCQSRSAPIVHDCFGKIAVDAAIRQKAKPKG